MYIDVQTKVQKEHSQANILIIKSLVFTNVYAVEMIYLIQIQI